MIGAPDAIRNANGSLGRSPLPGIECEFGLLDNSVDRVESSPADAVAEKWDHERAEFVGLLRPAQLTSCSALAALFTAAFATAPHWISPA